MVQFYLFSVFEVSYSVSVLHIVLIAMLQFVVGKLWQHIDPEERAEIRQVSKLDATSSCHWVHCSFSSDLIVVVFVPIFDRKA